MSTFVMTSLPWMVSQSSALRLILLSLLMLHFGSCGIVHVHVPELHWLTSTPDELNVTVTQEDGTSTLLHLTRSSRQPFDVQLLTLKRDQSGQLTSHMEQMADDQDVLLYEDRASAAVFQVTTEPSGLEQGSNVVLRGELKINDETFSLNPKTRVRRDASSLNQSQEVQYDLQPQPQPSFTSNDYLEAPPVKERRFLGAELDTRRLSQTLSQLPTERDLHRRAASKDINLDIVAFVDFSVFSRMMTEYKTRPQTLKAARDYFAFVFNGVDQRYQGIKNSQYSIHVRLIKLILVEESSLSPFTEDIRRPGSPRDMVDAKQALDRFSDFINGEGRSFAFPSDHTVLFTGLDIYSIDRGSISKSTTGLAYTRTFCRADGKSSSIVEDFGGFQPVETTAHEIGHSLGVLHDGDSNPCQAADRNIMSPGGYPINSGNKLNSWVFSTCSVKSLDAFINEMLRNKQGQSCLLQQLPVDGSVPDVSTRLPGHEHSPDSQCQMIYGPESQLCRGSEFGSPEDICTSMFCSSPDKRGVCMQHKAARGTTCGNGKLCLNGLCVPDSRAPTVEDSCVFGDQPGLAFPAEQKTCAQMVASYSGYCYDSVVKSRCCGSCQKIYTGIAGCEYGDKARQCKSAMCARYTPASRQNCCGSCSTGSKGRIDSIPKQVERLVPSTASERTSTTDGPIDPVLPIAQTPDDGTPRPPVETCADSDFNGWPCADIISSAPIVCQFSTMSSRCCQSCRSFQP